MLIFFDTETSGTNIEFDQVLQFGAVLTNDELKEIDRFELRCQLLPWVVPSPQALLVNGIPLDQLTDPNLPTFLSMMSEIRRRLQRWSPATFIGFNSMRFDEPLLQRAFWQALLPPYLTVTEGNARLDMLAVLRAATHFRPESISVSTDDRGKAVYQLASLAAANRFDTHKAHDALGDVEATLFLARLLSENIPDFWSLLLKRAPKRATNSVITFGKPVLVFQYIGGKPKAWFGQRIDRGEENTSHALVMPLATDAEKSVGSDSSRVRRIPLNKAPVVFTVDEAQSLFNLSPSPSELALSSALASDANLSEALLKALQEYNYRQDSRELEETMFDGFPPRADEVLMERFHTMDWVQKLEIIPSFSDERIRRLALRYLYVSSPDLLATEERTRIEAGITHRISTSENEPHRWRSALDALAELDQLAGEHWDQEKLLATRAWLIRRLESSLH